MHTQKNKNLWQNIKVNMEKSKVISIMIKTSIGILFAVFFVVLLSQYIVIAQLNNKNDKLKAELATSTQQYEELDKEYQDIF